MLIPILSHCSTNILELSFLTTLQCLSMCNFNKTKIVIIMQYAIPLQGYAEYHFSI